MEHRKLFVLFVLAFLFLISTTVEAGGGTPVAATGVSGWGAESYSVELLAQIEGWAVGVVGSGHHVYIAGWDNGLRLVDVSDPYHPILVGQYEAPSSVYNASVLGDYAYVAASYAGLRVVNISDPSHLSEVGFCHIPGEALDVAASGGYAYVTSWGYLDVVDISDPAAPAVVAYCTIDGFGYDVTVFGGYVYVAIGGDGVQIVDVSDPTHPVVIGAIDTPGSANGVTVSGDYAYIADGYEGLRVIDVSDPKHPAEFGSYDTPGMAENVAVSGGYAYVADWDEGLRVIDVKKPAHPREVGFYDALGQSVGVEVLGDNIYVASREQGVSILRYRYVSSTYVGPDGGTLSAAGDQTTYVFPPGAFTDTVVITHTARFASEVPSTGGLQGIDHFFEVTAVYSDTGQPAQLASGKTYTVSVRYTDEKKGAAIEDTLGLYWWNGSEWSRGGITSMVDTANNVVTAQVGNLSTFAVLGETKRIYLPLVLRNR